MNFTKVLYRGVICPWLTCSLIRQEFCLELLFAPECSNLLDDFLYQFSFSRILTSFKRNPSSPFLRTFWFICMVCGHYIRRGVRPLYIVILGKIYIYCQVMGVSPFLLTKIGWRHLAMLPTYRSRAGRCGYLELLQQGCSFHQILHRCHVLDDHSIWWGCVVSVPVPTLSGPLRLLCSWRGDFPQLKAVGRPPSPDGSRMTG